MHDDKIMWDVWLSRYHLPALAAADTLGIFQKIQNGMGTPHLVAEALGIDIRGIEALTCFLVAFSFLKKIRTHLTLTQNAKKFLLPDSDFYWGAALCRAHESPEYFRILSTFKAGQAAQLAENGKCFTQMWQQGEIDTQTAKNFTAIMHCTILTSAQMAVKSGVFSNIKYLLDVGGGSGCFASAFLKEYPGAKAAVFELPAVCQAAQEYLGETGGQHQVELYPGDFFRDSFPAGIDGILFSNILHDWQPKQAAPLIKKAYGVLPKGGSVFIHEMLLSKESQPLATATFNLLMYINHGSQQYTKEDLYSLLAETGFQGVKTIRTHPYYSVTVAEK